MFSKLRGAINVATCIEDSFSWFVLTMGRLCSLSLEVLNVHVLKQEWYTYSSYRESHLWVLEQCPL